MDKYLRNKKVELFFQSDIQLEEVFLDKLAQKKEQELGNSENKFEVPLSKKIFQGFYLILVVLILFLFGKTFYLQVIEGDNFLILAEQNRIKTLLIQPERGVIYDRAMNQLVWNVASFDLILDRRDFPITEKEQVKAVKEVSQIIGENFEYLKSRIVQEQDLIEVVIKENIDHQALVLLKARIGEFPGFQIRENIKRYYLDGPIFSHLIGHMGRITREDLTWLENYSYAIDDYIGRTGVEGFYEKILRGQPGKKQIKRDVFGIKISEEEIYPPEQGKSLVLHLDSHLQRKITEELEIILEQRGVQKASAVALDPNTGGVLAMVSIPKFDNNFFTKDISQAEWEAIKYNPLAPLLNRVISGTYLVGSVIKPLLGAAFLEEGLISPEKEIFSPEFIEIGHRYKPEITFQYWDWKFHGWTDIRKAIADSVNVFFYKLGGGYGELEGLGAKRIKEYLELFGWGQETQIDLVGEAVGLIPCPEWKRTTIGEPWHLGNTYHLSIGQGYIRATPLQVAASFVPIANRGKLLKPRVAQKIIKTPSFEEIKHASEHSERSVEKKRSFIEPEIIREGFISPENLEVIRQGMRQAVTDGTATILNYLPVEAAAKTGTAETPRPGFYHNWITVFAPYDAPQIVLTILIENLEGFQAPANIVAKNVLEDFFQDDQ